MKSLPSGRSQSLWICDRKKKRVTTQGESNVNKKLQHKICWIDLHSASKPWGGFYFYLCIFIVQPLCLFDLTENQKKITCSNNSVRGGSLRKYWKNGCFHKTGASSPSSASQLNTSINLLRRSHTRRKTMIALAKIRGENNPWQKEWQSKQKANTFASGSQAGFVSISRPLALN